MKMSKRMVICPRHYAIVARFEEFLEANSDRPLHLAEICPAIGVAERTLRIACEEHLGMGPIRYHSSRRMHLVRCALVRADPSTATVTRIATDHGFWELGRFSVTYRSLFGETPSETLRRSDRPMLLDRLSTMRVHLSGYSLNDGLLLHAPVRHGNRSSGRLNERSASSNGSAGAQPIVGDAVR